MPEGRSGRNSALSQNKRRHLLVSVFRVSLVRRIMVGMAIEIGRRCQVSTDRGVYSFVCSLDRRHELVYAKQVQLAVERANSSLTHYPPSPRHLRGPCSVASPGMTPSSCEPISINHMSPMSTPPPPSTLSSPPLAGSR